MNPINIVCTIDDNYVQHCGVMLCSLFENNPDTKFRIFILTEGLLATNNAKLQSFTAKYQQELIIKKVDATALDKAPTSYHITKATYYRLYIPALIPESIDKILFLDVDIIIKENIKALVDLDITNYAIAAGIDPRWGNFRKKELNIPENKPYFNAGIMIMNLQKWRAEGIADRILNYINEHYAILRFWDQDALNAQLYDDVYIFSSEWNAVEDFFMCKRSELTVTDENYTKTTKHPKIIHYSSPRKPWYLENNHPLKKEYKTYLAKTPWRNYSYTRDFFKRLPIRFLVNHYILNPIKTIWRT